jgi:Nucleotidyl transferase AbiEii toxin, Type IV TA system
VPESNGQEIGDSAAHKVMFVGQFAPFSRAAASLSKGFGIIQRFSEDIDIRIEPSDGLQVDTNPNHEKPQHIESKRIFYEKLRDKIKIPGIMSVERDATYDDQTLRNAGLRLTYETHFGSIAGLKDGILLEVGFDQTAPNRSVTISSWIVQFAEAKKLQYADNRAPDIRCYNPEYTFVEKVQAVVRKYGQFKATGKLPPNFLRHYYDIHQLLDVEGVQNFIGTAEYLEHKKKRFKSLDHDVAKSGAFTIEDENVRMRFEAEYSKTASLYYRGQIPFGTILARIRQDLARF